MVQQSAATCGYTATRPRAERLGDYGLLGDEDGVGLERAMGELDHYTGNVWIHILSLKRADWDETAVELERPAMQCDAHA